MKTKLLYAALFLSPAVFGQDAKVNATQSVEVKAAANVNDKAAVSASGSANSANAIHATQSTVNATGQTAADVQARTAAKVKQRKAEVTARTAQTVNTASERIAQTEINSSTRSSANIAAGNKLNAATSLDNTGSIAARPVKANTAVRKEVAVKTSKVNAATTSAVQQTTAIRPHPVKVKSVTSTSNSTLLKLR